MVLQYCIAHTKYINYYGNEIWSCTAMNVVVNMVINMATKENMDMKYGIEHIS